MRSRSFKQALGREHVVAEICFESSSPACADSWLAGQMKDDVGVGDERICVRGRKVKPPEVERVPLTSLLEVSQFILAAVVLVEAVNPGHCVPVLEQGVAQMRANEPGASGD